MIWILLIATLAFTPAALAVDVNLEWDAVQDARVVEYEIGRGVKSGEYTLFQSVAVPLTTATVQGLANGDEWFFVVRACGASHLQCSAWSNEVKVAIPFAAPGNLILFIVIQPK